MESLASLYLHGTARLELTCRAFSVSESQEINKRQDKSISIFLHICAPGHRHTVLETSGRNAISFLPTAFSLLQVVFKQHGFSCNAKCGLPGASLNPPAYVGDAVPPPVYLIILCFLA